MIKSLPEVDQAIFHDPIRCKELIDSTLEAFRNGVAGPALEMKILLSSWGFGLENIKFPVSIWHGAKDTQVPISNGKLYKNLMRNATLHIFENDGHHSMIQNHFEQIIKSI